VKAKMLSFQLNLRVQQSLKNLAKELVFQKAIPLLQRITLPWRKGYPPCEQKLQRYLDPPISILHLIKQ